MSEEANKIRDYIKKEPEITHFREERVTRVTKVATFYTYYDIDDRLLREQPKTINLGIQQVKESIWKDLYGHIAHNLIRLKGEMCGEIRNEDCNAFKKLEEIFNDVSFDEQEELPKMNQYRMVDVRMLEWMLNILKEKELDHTVYAKMIKDMINE